MLISSILIITLFLIIPSITTLNGAPREYIKNIKTGNVKHVNRQWICSDGAVLKIIRNPGLTAKFREPDFLVFTYKKYLKYLEEGKLGPVKGRVQIVTLTGRSTDGQREVLALVKPELTKLRVSISGSLTPGTFHKYGPYTSCLAIEVSVTWTPSNQMLGIGIVDAETGEGYGYWFTGGSAQVQFTTDWTKSYYIYILSYENNTETITYSGTITLYIW